MSKTVLITGASKGIGATMAIRYAEKGYNVVMNYNSSVQSAILYKNPSKRADITLSHTKLTLRTDLKLTFW